MTRATITGKRSLQMSPGLASSENLDGGTQALHYENTCSYSTTASLVFKIIKILLHWFHLSLLSIAHIPCLEGFQWNHPFTTSCVFLTHNSVITPDKATIPWNQQVELEV